MDDAFTLVGRATALLPEDAVAENGVTVGDVREDIRRQEWETALGLLLEIGDAWPVTADFWAVLAEAARQMMLDRTARWCEWREGETRHGVVRATLSLRGTEEGGRRGAFSGDGRLRPLWDLGRRSASGEPVLDIARLWVEFVPTLGPGETSTVRLAPICSERWRHLRCGDVITMHEGRPPVGTATLIEIAPPAQGSTG